LIKNIVKFILFLLLTYTNLYSCTAPIVTIPIIDAYVSIDAKESSTSFNISWEFNEEFITSLSYHDKNNNGKFDKDEQENIKKSFITYVEKYNYLTDIIYIKKGQKIKKSQLRKLNITDSGLIFSDDGIKFYFNFDTDFILEKDHRLYIRVFDIKANINVTLKEVVLNNYSGIKVIESKNTRANIYFYEHLAKDNALKESEHCISEEHEHEH